MRHIVIEPSPRSLPPPQHHADRHVTVTHESLTIRTPGEPTEHRPLRDGELEEWLTTLDVPLTDVERTRLLDKVNHLNP